MTGLLINWPLAWSGLVWSVAWTGEGIQKKQLPRMCCALMVNTSFSYHPLTDGLTEEEEEDLQHHRHHLREEEEDSIQSLSLIITQVQLLKSGLTGVKTKDPRRIRRSVRQGTAIE